MLRFGFWPAVCLFLIPVLLPAQTRPGYGWSSMGILPFGGYDLRIMKAPTQYVLYYTSHQKGDPNEGPGDFLARAFSTDLKTWTQDMRDVCSTSGDLCSLAPSVRTGIAGSMNLPDGTIRMFARADGPNGASFSAPSQRTEFRLPLTPECGWCRTRLRHGSS
jgi:hypothetical protein